MDERVLRYQKALDLQRKDAANKTTNRLILKLVSINKIKTQIKQNARHFARHFSINNYFHHQNRYLEVIKRLFKQ